MARPIRKRCEHSDVCPGDHKKVNGVEFCTDPISFEDASAIRKKKNDDLMAEDAMLIPTMFGPDFAPDITGANRRFLKLPVLGFTTGAVYFDPQKMQGTKRMNNWVLSLDYPFGASSDSDREILEQIRKGLAEATQTKVGSTEFTNEDIGLVMHDITLVNQNGVPVSGWSVSLFFRRLAGKEGITLVGAIFLHLKHEVVIFVEGRGTGMMLDHLYHGGIRQYVKLTKQGLLQPVPATPVNEPAEFVYDVNGNEIAFRAEERLSLSVQRPQSFVHDATKAFGSIGEAAKTAVAQTAKIGAATQEDFELAPPPKKPMRIVNKKRS